MTALLLIAALALVGIGGDIFRFATLRKPARHEQEKYVFGDREVSETGRQRVMTQTYFASGNAMRYLAVILIAAGLCLGASAMEMI